MPPTAASRAQPLASTAASGRPFLGLIDAVIVADPVAYQFDGAIPQAHASAAWTWMVRDVAPGTITSRVLATDPDAPGGLSALLPELQTRARSVLDSANTSREIQHRIHAQLGGDEPLAKLPTVLMALKCRPAIEKAQTFGRAANGIHDEAALAMALQSMPLQDRAISALLMQAAVGQVAAPARLVTAALRLAGGATEQVLTKAGFGPLIDALLAHAQNQIPALLQVGTYADIDLVCRAIDRFYRLMRGINAYVELSRGSRWSSVVAGLTRTVSGRIEPRLRDVIPDLNGAMRRPREGADRVDSDRMLAALNGVYLLAAIRDARDALAVNAIFDPTWTQVGQIVEMHVQRSVEVLRENPADKAALERLEGGIKMAELRFGVEYAEILRRARDSATRR